MGERGNGTNESFTAKLGGGFLQKSGVSIKGREDFVQTVGQWTETYFERWLDPWPKVKVIGIFVEGFLQLVKVRKRS